MSRSLRPAWQAMVIAALALAAEAAPQPAAAQTCSGPLRKINVGVSVSPPNVVHTAAYVAKELGIFAKHCIDANIIQFDGGSSPAASGGPSPGTPSAAAHAYQIAPGT